MVIEMMEYFQRLTGLAPGVWFCAPLTLAANVRGIEQFLIDIYTQPAFARDLLERLTEDVIAPWILHMRARFPDATRITGADAVASLPIVNTQILREWATPAILQLRELCGPEVAVSNWVGERYLRNPEEMLDLRLRVGTGGILGQDPDVEQLGPDFYRDYAISRGAPLILGVGSAFLAESVPHEVTQRVRRYVAEGRKVGRFALYLCNVGASTPADNVRAAIEAAHEFGVEA